MIKVQVRASQVKFGDRLVATGSQGPRLVTQVRARDGEIIFSHGVGETRVVGDPWMWVLRKEPRVVGEQDELPAPIWHPRGPRRAFPWEGGS